MRKSAKDVLAEVANAYSVTVDQLIGRNRTHPLVFYRQEAAFQIYVQCRHLSLPMIGRAMGGRDHTTIRHAIARHAERIGLTYADVFRETIKGAWKPPSWKRGLITPPTAEFYRDAQRLAA